MSGPLFAEALATLFTVCRALAAWIAVLAFVVTVAIYTAVLTGVFAWRAVRRRSTGAQTAPQPPETPAFTPNPAQRRTGPSWARDDHEQQEAA